MTSFSDFLSHLSARTPPLLPAKIADAQLSNQIAQADLFGGKQGDMVETCRAGLWLLNDDLHRAHEVVQHESSINNFWHAILHRREGDFSNAHYWWHRTGSHPAFEEIYDLVIHRVPDFPFIDELRGSHAWEPGAFTDFCEKAARSGDWEDELCQVQRLEMKILLEWCAACV